MADLKKIGLQLIPLLPFIILVLAVIVAIYHINAYW